MPSLARVQRISAIQLKKLKLKATTEDRQLALVSRDAQRSASRNCRKCCESEAKRSAPRRGQPIAKVIWPLSLSAQPRDFCHESHGVAALASLESLLWRALSLDEFFRGGYFHRQKRRWLGMDHSRQSPHCRLKHASAFFAARGLLGGHCLWPFFCPRPCQRRPRPRREALLWAVI